MNVCLNRSVRSVLAVVVWAGSAATAYWLYRQSAAGDVVAIAEAREHKVAPAFLARLTSLEVVEGQRVTEGQVVARLETELIRREISIAEARKRLAASEVHATGASLDVGTLQAERGFRSEIEAADIELQAAQSSMARDRAELAKVTEELARQRDLVRRRLAKADRIPEMETRRAALDEAVRAWPPCIHAIETRRQQAAARLAEWRRAHSDSGGGSRKAQLRPVQDKVVEQEATIRLLNTHLHEAVLRAACDGYIASVWSRPGDVVAAGQAILSVVEARPRQVVAYMEERMGQPLSTGVRVLARRRVGAREQVEAKVVAVARQVSSLPARMWTSPTIPAWGRAAYIELPAEAPLDPGETVDILIPRSPEGAPPTYTASR